MFRFHIYLGLGICFGLLLNACSTVTPTLSQETTQDIRKAKVAVAFFDYSHSINYISEIYEVLNITTKIYYSSYEGYWDSDVEVTNIHAQELFNYGLRTESIYKLLNKKQIKTMRMMQNQFRLDKRLNPDSIPNLNSQIGELLVKNQIRYLILIDWSGYNLLIKTQGLPPRESLIMNFGIFETTQGKLVWRGSTSIDRQVNIEDKNPKYFLEDEDFAELKLNVTKLILSEYTRKTNNIGQLMGLIKERPAVKESVLFTDVQD